MPGVEDMQVQFGMDTGDYNNDGVIDTALRDGNNIPDALNGIATRYVNSNSRPAPSGRLQVDRHVRSGCWLRAEQPETGFVDNTNYVYADRNYTPALGEQTSAACS